ncbi:MAG: hypothetical protein KC553_13825 [Nitrospina sp.]|nr:hypothetical protein [Nitrospina sp.]
MLESLLILFILFLFITPVPALAVALGLSTSHFLYRKHMLLRYQPTVGKRLAQWTLACSAINLILSFLLALCLSLAVLYLLTDLFYLFLFNFVFCFMVSARWFDFTHHLYRSRVLALSEHHTRVQNATADSPLVMVYGLRKSIGWGAGLTPVIVDAGLLDLDRESLRFKGLFLDLNLGPHRIEFAQPVSSEKIAFRPRQTQPHRIETFWLVVRDGFYPFKCRNTRDRILSLMGHPVETPAETLAPATPGQPAG